MSNFDHSKIKFSSEAERKSYHEGLKLLEAKRRSFAPSLEETRARQLREGSAIVRKKLSAARAQKTLGAPAPARPAPAPTITAKHTTASTVKSFSKSPMKLHHYGCSGGLFA